MRHNGYGVKLVRGPFVTLAQHERHVPDIPSLLERRADFRRPLAVDLFCGAGGLSLGLESAGYDVVVGVDHDEDSLETHAHLFGGVSLDLDLGDASLLGELINDLRALSPALIAGGPPCQPFSRAGMSKIRDLVASGRRDAHDQRRELWRSFLAVVLGVRPPAVLLENVPDMALGGRMEIVRTIVTELETAGYAVHTRLLHAWEHGVPQHRQRLILVGLLDDSGFTWPDPSPNVVTVADAIGDLPPVEGGDRPAGGADGWWSWASPPGGLSPFAVDARLGLSSAEATRVRDHITRPVRDDDLEAFELLGPSMLYADLPKRLKRYRDDIFDDKYKRLDAEQPSRSITAHIARDGYWYIHPTQPRTLTVREAARLQTFPDRVRFAGPPSSAFRQIGNAVPPRLGEVVGRQVLAAGNVPVTRTRRSIVTSTLLAEWHDQQKDLAVPWARARTSWSALLGIALLSRTRPAVTEEYWPVLSKLVDPEITLENAAELREIGDAIRRSPTVERVVDAASWLVEHGWSPEQGDEDLLGRAPGITRDLASLALACGGGADITPVPVTAPLLRLVRRVTGRPVDELRSRSDGRLEIARLVGGSLNGRSACPRGAAGAAVELAAQLCKQTSPRCGVCPLSGICASATL